MADHKLSPKVMLKVKLGRGTITFAQLDQLLKAAGFAAVKTEGTHKLYQDSNSKALLVFPNYQETEQVRPIHLQAVRRALGQRTVTVYLTDTSAPSKQ